MVELPKEAFKMSEKKKVHHVGPLNENKKQIISALIDEYDIETADDIQEALKDLLGGTIKGMMEAEMDDHLGYKNYERSKSFISDVTDKILQDIDNWQNRPLDSVYPIVFIDAVHFSVREDNRIKKLAAYVILGIDHNGYKDVLALEVGENESSKYWLGVLSAIFKFSQKVLKVIYTTNAIESLNSTYKKLNRQRSVFPSDTALLKALYLSALQATKKWTMPLRNWAKVYGEFSIMYPDRMSE